MNNPSQYSTSDCPILYLIILLSIVLGTVIVCYKTKDYFIDHVRERMLASLMRVFLLTVDTLFILGLSYVT